MSPSKACNRDYARELIRGSGGAILFAFPLLMTMEMWWLGFYMDRLKLALFIAVGLLLLGGLSYYVGFSKSQSIKDSILDAFSAYAIGVVISAALLALFGIVQNGIPLDELLGKIALQSIPAGIGAALARTQFAAQDDEEQHNEKETTYLGELFLMFGGAIFIAFNVAPTEEMPLISKLMTPWHGIALALVSVALLHVLVYTVQFSGQEKWPENQGFFTVFYRFSLAGYGIALLVSLYILWTFGRTDGTSFGQAVMMAIVLGFPSSLGAATARLVI